MDFFIFAAALNFVQSLVWEIISVVMAIVLKPLGFGVFWISDGEIVTKFKKMSVVSSYEDEDGKKDGIVCGKWFVGMSSKMYGSGLGSNGQNRISVICSKRQIQEMMMVVRVSGRDDGDVIEVKKDEMLSLYYKKNVMYGDVWGKKFVRRTRLNPRKDQQKIVDGIVKLYKENFSRSVCVVISGEVGVGKSSIGAFVASEVNGVLCKTFTPCGPGHDLHGLHVEVGPTDENPLVVLVDEVDVLVEKIHGGEVEEYHGSMGRMCYDKQTWNSFLDSVEAGDYPNTVIVFTSNKGKEYFDGMDESYLREGRVAGEFKM